MKKYIHFFFGVLVLSLLACSSPGSVSSSDKKEAEADIMYPDNSISLVEHLRRVSGVRIQGNGPGATITIRGVGSINSSNEPLFVINGQPITGGLRAATQLVPVQEIKAIRVLKNPDEVGIYGVRGGNGVIEIDLKKN